MFKSVDVTPKVVEIDSNPGLTFYELYITEATAAPLFGGLLTGSAQPITHAACDLELGDFILDGVPLGAERQGGQLALKPLPFGVDPFFECVRF